MADFLTLNQYAVPIKNTSASGKRSLVGYQRRAFDGTLLSQRRAHKRSWRFRTTLLSETEAYALAGLLAGEGHHWSFADASDYLYSSKGLAKATGTATRTATAGKFGAYITVAAGAEVVWETDVPDYTDSTIMVWYYTSGAWHHYIRRGDGAKWVDGVRNDAASIPFISITSDGKAHLGDTGSGAGQDFDDLVVLPFACSAAQAEAWGVMTAAFSALPTLTAAGDFVVGTSVSVQSAGEVSWANFQGVSSGSWKQNLYELEFELTEA